MARRRASIRYWQTGLFVVVIVVAMLILSGSLSAGLVQTLTDMGEANESRNASALARRLEPEFPPSPESRERIRAILVEYRSIYGAGIWVYDRTGTLLESSFDTGPTSVQLEEARTGALTVTPAYATMEPRAGGWAVAGRAIRGSSGSVEGVVVTASPVDDSLRILGAVRDRLWVTFWISLVIAGLLGLGFSEIIRRRLRAMLDAAGAIASGDFDQRLPIGLMPDEVQDLALSYNRMAGRLGEAFGAIRENERRIAAVVESMAEGVVAFDASGAVRVINPEAMRLLGISDAEAMGAPAAEITTIPEVHEAVAAGLEGRGTARLVSVEGVTMRVQCTPLFASAGDIDGAVLLLADVTEQRRIEDAQRRFVADASHEMRTPIAAIKGMLELLADGAQDDPEVREDFIGTMQVEADRLGRLVSDLLTLAQLDAGSLHLTPAPEWAADLLGDVARLMHPLAERAGVELTVEAPEAGGRIRADRDRVVQVLLSFTDNAIKHSESGTMVHLRARAVADEVVLEVADEGPGIDAEALERVFERFYRADAARSGGKGAGLGLAIAKEIVEAHGSCIEIESAPGAGTTFGFRLPLA
ncbi:MAG: ATP-binding protein [Actinomycetota bacterium]|nr:ATP-binding protein [Actinomycetota bacterium]MDZ4179053.1 ATP-binding protein [Coriobacteriia bacterium]